MKFFEFEEKRSSREAGSGDAGSAVEKQRTASSASSASFGPVSFLNQNVTKRSRNCFPLLLSASFGDRNVKEAGEKQKEAVDKKTCFSKNVFQIKYFKKKKQKKQKKQSPSPRNHPQLSQPIRAEKTTKPPLSNLRPGAPIDRTEDGQAVHRIPIGSTVTAPWLLPQMRKPSPRPYAPPVATIVSLGWKRDGIVSAVLVCRIEKSTQLSSPR